MDPLWLADRCWMCNAPLDADETQYCTVCELKMLRILAEEEISDQEKIN